MKNTTLTAKEALTRIAAMEIEPDIAEWVAARLAAIEASHAKEAERRAAKKTADEPIIAQLLAAISETPQTASDLKSAIEADVSVQKISSLLRPYIENGAVSKTEVKIDGKKRVAYVKGEA